MTYVNSVVTGMMRRGGSRGRYLALCLWRKGWYILPTLIYALHRWLKEAVIYSRGIRLGSAIDIWLLVGVSGPYFMRDPRIHNLL